jgi:hypothetical protein
MVVLEEGIEDVACTTCRVSVKAFTKHRVLIPPQTNISWHHNPCTGRSSQTDFHGWRYVFSSLKQAIIKASRSSRLVLVS